ncbi:hypothetical protein LP420_04225 [Massilia sp. B-10]|nr:hypothetical protein LP420_04225 [Massilia sp. B-10]UUZ55064.1 hypothetical protein LP419_03985 [Massilia sp. H-1]
MEGQKSRKKGVTPFLLVPMALLNCPKYRALSSSAVKLLYDIASQFNGKNNGDLCAAWKIMRPKGWKSEATLHKAKRSWSRPGSLPSRGWGTCRIHAACTELRGSR